MIKWSRARYNGHTYTEGGLIVRYGTETRTKKVTVMVDGKPNEVEVTYEAKVPKAPLDWDTISTRVGVGLVGTLTCVSVVWSTLAIGDLLGGGVGFAAAAMFDISWAVCLILEWKARYDETKRTFPRALGWVLLGVTMFFIGWHGVQHKDIPLAVVGASVSLFAKILWLGLMKHIDRELSPAHKAWVRQQTSEAHAKLALAQIRRQVARQEDAAARELLALESARRQFDFPDVVEVEPARAGVELGGSTIVPSNSPDSSIGGTAPLAPESPGPVRGGSMAVPSRGTGGTGGSSTHGTAPGTIPADSSMADMAPDQAVILLAELIRRGHNITIDWVMKASGKSKTTASRWLKTARAKADEGTGFYV